MKNYSIVIMAGGLGKRMNSSLPKCITPLFGKPLLHYIFETILQLDNSPNIIYVCINSIHGQQVVDCILSKYSYLKNIRWVQLGHRPLGTGFTIQRLAQQYEISQPLLVLSGDVPLISKQTIQNILDIHFRTGANATLLTCLKTKPYGYGRIVKNEEDEFIQIVEEKDANQEQKKIQIVNAGTYCIDETCIQNELFSISCNNAQREYYLTDIFFHIKNNKKKIVLSHLPENKNIEVSGINTNEDLELLEEYLKNI
jgi:bifunctional UDP-N-acetylglucosamine pyrophosphorylase/glucosamine-1-phosphate N-acetyltransferase